MTTVEAMKLLICYILNDGTQPEDITESNATALWARIAEAFNTRFNGSSSGGSSSDAKVIGNLVVTSLPGTTVGATVITVIGATGNSLRYRFGGQLPSYNDDLSTWNTWDGVSEILTEDGTRICVAEVTDGNLAISAGMTIANTNIG